MNYDMCMQALTPNLMVGDEQRDFFVWVDPQAFLEAISKTDDMI